MNHEEYKYVNVSTNGAFNRKNLIDYKRLGSPEGLKDAYMTYFRYNDEMVEHFNKNKTVAKFKGSAWSEWLPIDIDSEDLEESQMYLTTIIQRLADYGIDENTCRFYFSGNAGFHVMIPSAYFGAVPSEDIGKRFKRIAYLLSEGVEIDSSIYDKTRLFRLPNTINTKSGLYKVELYPFEAMSMSIKDIQHKALLPVEELDIDDEFDLSEELTEIYHSPFEKPKREVKSGAKAKICIETMMYEKDLEGERDNIGIRISSHLRQSGLNPKMMWVALNEWNDGLDAPLQDYEIERIFEQGLEGYQFGCKDEFLKGRCDPNCLFFQDDWQDAQERIDNYESRKSTDV